VGQSQRMVRLVGGSRFRGDVAQRAQWGVLFLGGGRDRVRDVRRGLFESGGEYFPLEWHGAPSWAVVTNRRQRGEKKLR